MESLAGVAGAHGLRRRAQSAVPSPKSDAAVAPAPAGGGGEPADDGTPCAPAGEGVPPPPAPLPSGPSAHCTIRAGDADAAVCPPREGGWRKSWKRRFFVLTGASLSYYAEDRPGAAPKGTIDLDDVVRCVDHEPAAGDKSGKAFNTFAVETLQRTYFVRAATHGERHAWVQAINGASLNP